MKTKVLALSVLFGMPVAAAPAPDSAPSEDSRISVIFVEPENFTDVKYSHMDDTSVDLLGEIQKFIRETAEKLVPTDQKLEVRVTDIDLAGDFEPWLGGKYNDVRIVRSIYPPRIKLDYRVIDGSGKVVSSGHRELTNLTYQMQLVWPRDDYLKYEKDLLREWLGKEFRNTRA